MKTALKWLWWGLMELLSIAFFWLPLPFVWELFPRHHFTYWAFTPPIGLTIVAVFCIAHAWTSADTPSIKPLPNGRDKIDRWRILDWLIGDREDGGSGRYAYGNDWTGPYNATGSAWGAFCWNCRNWMANFNYITWPWPAAPPLLIKPYGNRQLKIGWQYLPDQDGWKGPYRIRMVGSF